MKLKIKLVVVTVMLAAGLSCNKEAPTGPNDDVVPGGRNYTWTVDTISGEFTNLYRLWGDSPNNIWIVGTSGPYNKTMWHYDGKTLSPAGDYRMAPECIFGFGYQNIWAGDYSIWHFDGSIWTKQFTPRIDSLKNREGDVWLWDIKGKFPWDVWSVGFAIKDQYTTYGAIYNCDGEKWTRKFITKQNHYAFYRIFPTGKGNKYFIWGLKRDYHRGIDTSAIFEYDGNNTLKEVYSDLCGTGYQCYISTVNDEIYISMNRKIYRYYNGSLNEYIPLESIKNGGIVGGRSSKDIFVWLDGGLAHYNGTDIQYIFRNKSNSFSGIDKVRVFKDDIYFFGDDLATGNYLFVHGKLNH